ncbi:MAG: membrane dipeptidase, partial [Alphaproteobacteria bacterium]|nr:membrane dipeptidase [Alphaproteobacteria bacterium]
MIQTLFDGHNDLLSQMAAGKCCLQDVRDGYGAGHIDLPRARQGGFGGGFFAIFVEDSSDDLGNVLAATQHPPYHLDIPPEVPHHTALPVALHQAAEMQRLHRAGIVHLCTDTATLEAKLHAPDVLAAVL